MRTRIRRALPAAGCALLPVAATLLLVRHYFDQGLSDQTPIWSDEIGYWRETFTFQHVGFGGGYYTIDEQPATAAFTHFGAHGPSAAVLFGFIARLTGWAYASGPVYNLVCLGIAIAGYVWMTKPDRWQLGLTALALLSFWPMMLYIPSTMQESVHQALAIALAGLFYFMIKYPNRRSGWAVGLAAALLLIASVLRPTWSPLFLVLLLFRSPKVSVRRLVLSALAALPVVLVAFMVNRWMASPFPYFINDAAEAAKRSIWQGVKMVGAHVRTNLRMLAHGDPLDHGLRIGLLTIVVLSIGVLVHRMYRTWRAVGDADRAHPAPARDLYNLSLFHLVNLGSIVVFVLVANDVFDWRGYRLLAPHVLLSMFVTIPFARRRLVSAALRRRWLAPAMLTRYALFLVPVLVNVLLVASFAGSFKSFNTEHFSAEARRPSLLAEAVSYRAGADPWSNTVLVDLSNYTPELLQLPAGVGVSLILEPQSLQKPIKSRYLLVADSTLPLIGESGAPDGMRLVGETRSGKLYERTD